MQTENQIILGETVYSFETALKGFEIKNKPSSNVAFYGYDEHYNRLFIQFKNGNSYIYKDIKPELFAEMDKSESVGKFFSQNIAGRYEHTKYTNQLIVKEGILS